MEFKTWFETQTEIRGRVTRTKMYGRHKVEFSVRGKYYAFWVDSAAVLNSPLYTTRKNGEFYGPGKVFNDVLSRAKDGSAERIMPQQKKPPEGGSMVQQRLF